MNRLIQNFGIEIYKLFKWRVVILFICLSGILGFLCAYIFDTTLSTNNAMFGMSKKANLWYSFVGSGFRVLYVVILSLLSSFIPVLMLQIEHKNKAFNLWSALPVSQFDLFLQKLLVMFFFLFCFTLICSTAIGLGLYINGINNKPELLAYSFLPLLEPLSYYGLSFFICQMGILTLLLLTNFYIKNFPLAMVLSFTFWLLSFIVPKNLNFLPFVFALRSVLNFTRERGYYHPYNLDLFNYELKSLLWLVLMVFIAFWLSKSHLLFPKK